MEITENGQDTSSTATSLLHLASVSQQPYVSELLSFTLDRLHKVRYIYFFEIIIIMEKANWICDWWLKKEPELLRVDAERIQRQMQEVAVVNYRAFISAADSLLAIRQQVSSIDNHLESLVLLLILVHYWCIAIVKPEVISH